MNEPLPSERQLLLALKRDDTPSDADRERVRARVLAALAGGAGASALGLAGKSATAAPKAAFALAPAAKAVAVVGVIGSGALFTLQQWSTTPPAATQLGAAVNGAAATSSAAEPPAPQETAALTPSAPDVQAEAPVQGHDSPPVTRASAKNMNSPRAADLDAEVRLLRAAQQALAAGRYPEALGKLSEHAQRYPRGLLRNEREASRSIALCQSGQLSAGQSRARTYLGSAADAPLATRVRKACKLD
jgi:TolA-binding protein